MQLFFDVTADENGRRLSDFLRAHGLTGGLIKSVKYADGIKVNGVPAHTNYRLKTGERVTVTLPPEPPTQVEPQPVPLDIVYEDDFCAVINKPAGVLVHPSCPEASGTLANGWCELMQRRGTPCPFRPVNRLDKNTSGLMLAAKNSFAAAALSGAYEKSYLAVIEGELPQGSTGRIDLPILRTDDSIITRETGEGGKPSVTAYTVLRSAGGHSLVKAVPITGRTHQIRVHLSAIGHPLAGDDLYGGHRQYIGRHALHSESLVFTPPLSAEKVRLSAPLPADMTQLLSETGLSPV